MDKEIYDNLLKNSIGKDKKCKKSFVIRDVLLKVSLPIIIGVIMASSLTGCIKTQHVDTPEDKAVSQMLEITDDYSFNLGDVRVFERNRLYKLLDDNDITDYIGRYGKRDYNCSEEDYRSVDGLDESYLYAMYFASSREDAETLARALNYKSLDDFLIKKGYVDENGNPSVDYWLADDAIKMAGIMNSEYNSKGASK